MTDLLQQEGYTVFMLEKWIWFLLACDELDVEEKQKIELTEREIVTQPLEPIEFTRRLSLDLVGRIPSEEELELVLNSNQNDDEDNLYIEEVLEVLLKDPAHERRLVDLFSEWMLTRVDQYNATYRSYGLGPMDAFSFRRSIGEEPLRLMAYVGSRDLPWTEIVTADHTMANEMLMEIWPLEPIEPITEDSPEWVQARYIDGRPAGGVVMTNGLWWRYYTTPHNYSRTRAMALAELLLCENYLIRPIKFSAPSLLERDALNEIIQSDPACIGCHSTLDPLAASLFGFWWFDLYDVTEMTYYHPEREPLGMYYLNLQASFFGQPLETPAQLGVSIANDSRFERCSTERMASLLWRRDVSIEDFNTIEDLRQDFSAGEHRLSSLIKAIVSGAQYQAGSLLDNASETDAQRESTRRMLSAQQVASAIHDLTGFVWEIDSIDMLEDDTEGFRTLLGGIDGITVTRILRSPNLSRQLALKRLTQAAAGWVVTEDWTRPIEDRILLKPSALASHSTTHWDNLDDLNPIEDPQDWLEPFVLRLYGASLSQEQLDIYTQIWDQTSEDYGPQQAWKTLISVMLRDPGFWVY